MASTIRNLTVSFGLVEFPASLKKASEKRDVTFESAVRVFKGKDEKDNPIYEYERVAQARTGSRTGSRAATASEAVGDVTATTVVKGVWVSEDDFRPVPDGALEKISESTQIEGIEIEEFVPLKNIAWERVEGAYYLTPQKGLIGAKPMRLLRDALKAEKAAGVCKLCLKGTGGRQKLAVVHADSEGRLVVNLLAFAGDFRDADESAKAIETVEVNREMLRLARQMIRDRVVQKSALLDGAEDAAVAERERLFAALLDGSDQYKPKAATPSAEPVGDLMEALRASIEQSREKANA